MGGLQGLINPGVAAGTTIADIVLGMAKKRSMNRYADRVGDVARGVGVASGVHEAEGMLTELAGVGLPGAESIAERIMSNTAGSINELREIGTPGQVLSAASKVAGAGNDQLLDLELEDALQKLKNTAALAEFKGGTKAQAQTEAARTRDELNLMAEGARMKGRNAFIDSIASGIGGGFDVFSALEELKSLKELRGGIAAYYNK